MAQTGTTMSRRQIAVILSVVINVLSLPVFFLLPSDDDVPGAVYVIGTILAVVALVGAYGLWNGQRWGWWTTFIVTVLNLVTSLPGIVEWPSNAIGIAIIISIVLGVGLLVLLWKPDVRRSTSETTPLTAY